MYWYQGIQLLYIKSTIQHVRVNALLCCAVYRVRTPPTPVYKSTIQYVGVHDANHLTVGWCTVDRQYIFFYFNINLLTISYEDPDPEV